MSMATTAAADMRIAQRLRELREAANLSQDKLAEASGIPAGTIRNIEQGKRLPTWPTLRRLSAALGASLGDWSGLEDEDPTPVKKEAKKPKK